MVAIRGASPLYEPYMCQVCWHEAGSEMREHDSLATELVFLHGAFFSIACREWAICTPHADCYRDVDTIGMGNCDDCKKRAAWGNMKS